MAVALPTVSFILTALLGLLALFPKIHRDPVRMSLVLWLLLSNLVHAINAVAWSSNANIHVPVWCDITTKLLLATSVALPCALLCLACQLEFLASQRPIPSWFLPSSSLPSGEPDADANLVSKRLRLSKVKQMIFDLGLCVGFPVVFFCLHFIVQNNRFDITQDFGCSASIHPSTPGLIVTSLPPLILCVATFVIAGLAIHHSFLLPHSGFSQHIFTRSQQNPAERMSSSLFLRRMITILVLTAILMVFTLFTAFTRSTAEPFSWATAHAQFTKIHIVKGGDELRFVELSWWEVPVVSVVYVLLEIGLGQEVRDGIKDANKRVVKWQKRRNEKATAAKENVLPLHRPSTSTTTTTDVIHIQVPLEAINAPKTTHGKDLVSGWDDMIDLKVSPKSQKSNSPTPSDRSKSTPSPNASPSKKSLTCPSSPTRSLYSKASFASLADSSYESTKARKSCSSPISVRFPIPPSPRFPPPSPTSPEQLEDEAFTASTLKYLNSPTAQSLGLQSPASASPLTMVTPASPSPSSPSPVPVMQPPTVYTSPLKIGYDRTEPPWRSNGRVTPIPRDPDVSPPPSPPSPSPSSSRKPTIPKRNREIVIDSRIDETLLVPNRFLGGERKAAQNVPDDVESVISSIIEVPWPQPPSTIPPRSRLPISPRSESPASSDTSCVTESFGRPHSEDRPFRGPSISPVPSDETQKRPISPLNLVKKKGSKGLLNLPRNNKPTTHYGLPPGEAIYMTVVQETV